MKRQRHCMSSILQQQGHIIYLYNIYQPALLIFFRITQIILFIVHIFNLQPIIIKPNMTASVRSEIYNIEQYSHQVSPTSIVSPPELQSRETKAKTLKIPLIAKRMNRMEKYLSDFVNQTIDINRQRQIKKQRYEQSLNQSLLDDYPMTSKQKQKNGEHSVFISDIDHMEGQKEIKQSIIKYRDLKDHDSLQKEQYLTQMEQQYLQIKSKVKTHKNILPKICKSRYGYHSNSDERENISQEQIESHIKSTFVQEGDKRYFGDLYLLKKGRDQIMSSLSSIGKQQQPSQGKSYDKVVRDVKNYTSQIKNKHQSIKKEILQNREAKKNKMLVKKNLHWNVYYDMLALSNNQKHKLRRCCKFTSIYGIK